MRAQIFTENHTSSTYVHTIIGYAQATGQSQDKLANLEQEYCLALQAEQDRIMGISE